MTSQRNEADTRADLIDPTLIKCGWGNTKNSYIRRELICPGRIMIGGKRGAKVTSDYVLEYQGKKLGVVEAKKESLSYTEGVRQAIDYATRLQCRVAYATNGHEIYQIDMVTGEQNLVDRYLSPEELWALTFNDSGCAAEWRQRFSDVPFETKGGSWTARYYQENAINSALEAIAKGEDKVLLTLATGTGKTFIAFQLAWKLFYSRWTKAAQKDISKAIRRPRLIHFHRSLKMRLSASIPVKLKRQVEYPRMVLFSLLSFKPLCLVKTKRVTVSHILVNTQQISLISLLLMSATEAVQKTKAHGAVCWSILNTQCNSA